MTLRQADYAVIHNALETIGAVMRESAVVEMAGHAYFTDEAETIRRGIEAFKGLDPNPRTHAGRFQNEKKLSQAGKAVDMADILLERNGFQGLKGSAWSEHDREVIRMGLKAFGRATAHCRN